MTRDNNCEVYVPIDSINNGSYDPDGNFLDVALSTAGQESSLTSQFVTLKAPQSLHPLTLTVTDSDGAQDTCAASVTLSDK